ncbi:MAG TPA: hypothetical protein VNZ53_58590 [Steroidobacteraceae bacterium]|jgi:hypothetical protein|nr:hypothetical protein [Steroidobacteraceae bacterium]
MTDNIVQLPTSTRGDYFGGCPTCRRTNGLINERADHWFVCDTHKAKWYVGSNFFSNWREQTEEERFENRDKLAGYREVEPINDWNELEGIGDNGAVEGPPPF